MSKKKIPLLLCPFRLPPSWIGFHLFLLLGSRALSDNYNLWFVSFHNTCLWPYDKSRLMPTFSDISYPIVWILNKQQQQQQRGGAEMPYLYGCGGINIYHMFLGPAFTQSLWITARLPVLQHQTSMSEWLVSPSKKTFIYRLSY